MFACRNSEGPRHTLFERRLVLVVYRDIDAVDIRHLNLQQSVSANRPGLREGCVGHSRKRKIIRVDRRRIRERMLPAIGHLRYALVKVLDHLIKSDLAILVRIRGAAETFYQAICEDSVTEVVFLVRALGLFRGRDEADALWNLAH